MHFENVQPDRVFLSSDTGGAFFFPILADAFVVDRIRILNNYAERSTSIALCVSPVTPTV